ncbi:hypothetical protein LHP98_13150 [Rhodobacter sp. Har01]|uniref:hypothetical protein n=1 Tax=Rhodobacter sp. Har01 TaxID=2883999 RepID=UPI001D07BDB5|nr:hypothetical protein [Rhodobacter sp. Har01]MCB6179066.1 hypothetical protein [Rhodobacter sp. Har01]
MAQESAILRTTGADYDAVMAQMTALRRDLADLAGSVQALASGRGHALAKDVSDGMSEAVSYMGRKGHDADARIEGAVAANPYIALGLAAGMGVLLGALTRR